MGGFLVRRSGGGKDIRLFFLVLECKIFLRPKAAGDKSIGIRYYSLMERGYPMSFGKNFKRYSVKPEEYQRILDICKRILLDRDDVVFAYIHGSFLEMQNFGDIDLAVYLQAYKREDCFEYEFDLEKELKKKVLYPLDIKVLNESPPSFRYSVIKNGIILVDKDEKRRVNFETMTLSQYLDFLPFRKRYLKEALEGEI